ncbi:MAG TPA: hypothetical protein PK808_00390, partial [Polymorphobacter sp.]|nr:hypothetical protein [Polymorphobacter sp.]
TSRLLTADGRIVEIGKADPNDNFVRLVAPVTATQERYGVTTSFADPTSAGTGTEASYIEGRDAGALTIKASTNVLAGTLHAEAFAGTHQLANARPGTAASDLPGDMRALQASATQLPSGGLLKIQAMYQIGGAATSQAVTGGADIIVYAGSAAAPARNASEILLSDTLLSGSGFAGLTLQTSGGVTLARGSNLKLAAGGGLQIDAGRSIAFDGNVSVASGSIAARTYEVRQGSVFRSDDDLPAFIAATDATPHLFDINVTGTLSAAGRWVNDALVSDGAYLGGAFTDGGSISLTVAPRVLVGIDNQTAPDVSADLSGSIHIRAGARLDVTGGGYVKPDTTLALNGAGGDISLINQTSYFQLAADSFNVAQQSSFIETNVPSFRTGSQFGRANAAAPRALEAVVDIAAGTIAAQGFGTGGAFTLVTPELNFGAVAGAGGTALALDFVSTSGFADFSLTTWKTRLTPNVFSNGLAGNTALLDTQTVRIGSGQSLLLTQSTINALLDSNQVGALRALATGGDLIGTVGTAVASDAWDRLPVNLAFGGLTELDIASGGRIDGSAGASLTTAKLRNAGTIRIAGGSVRQSLALPTAYLDAARPALGVSDLATVFGAADSNGLFDENAANALGIKASATSSAPVMSNADLATLGGASRIIYFTGALAAGEGVQLLSGSVIDLSGTSIRNPRAGVLAGTTTQKAEGRLVGGGSLVTDAAFVGGGNRLFDLPGYGITRFIEPLSGAAITVRRSGDQLLAAAGATINIAGASDQYDQLVGLDRYALGPVWSDGGQLILGAGGSVAGARILADGGAAAAQGGTLIWLDPVLQQQDGATVVRDAVAADQIMSAGFDVFVAQDRLMTLGDVNLSLGRGFYLTARPYDGNPAQVDTLRAAIGTTGALAIAAPYVRLESPLQTVTPTGGVAGTGSLLFTATTVDIVGSVYFEPSLARVGFNVSGDFRLTGVESPQLTIIGGNSPVTITSALAGQMVANGDIDIRAAQIYPTTGTGSLQQDINAARAGTAETAAPYLIASTGADATIRFARSSTATPDMPWSAGGNLLVQAAHIDQSGVIRVPLGRLQLGSNATVQLGTSLVSQIVPVTQSVDIGSGSITSVSAGGLNIPYGTTTDLIEYFFAPTSDQRLFAPPAAELRLSADTVNVAGGATVDLSGGGDVYAYEFVAGIGGSRDVLSRTNSDAFSSNNGLQYADGRQVYAIVPSLANAAVAPFDPIYSSDYGALYAGADAGRRVYLEAGPGLTAGWYTLLPARYALLPGGMRVVENVGADAPAPGVSATLRDGSLIVGGHYGVSGTAAEESQRRTFTVMSQDVLRKYSRIELTSATTTFKALAERDKLAIPQLPADAARLVLTPLSDLAIASRFQTTIGSGGRGAQVDVAGNAFEIVAPGTAASGGNAITLTTTDFTNLNAASLLIGGTRRDRADGTTVLTATAQSILVANDAANPLSAPEVVLIVDGLDSRITLADGATIAGSGSLLDTRTGAYVINASVDAATPQTAIGGIVRVANGAERLVERPGALALANSLSQTDVSIGAATLTGTSVLLDSTRDLTIAANPLTGGQPRIAATNVALGGDDVFFTTEPSGFRGLTITPELEAQLAQAERLTITSKSIIGFSAGVHAFNDLVLDARGLRPYGQATNAPLPPPGFTTQTDTLVTDPSLPIAVRLQAQSLTLLNSDKDRGICGGTYVVACGTTGNTLDIVAQDVHFGSGAMRTYGFDAAVTLTATRGVYAEGTGTLDVDGARLTIDTPFLGDRALVADPRGQKLQPSLGLLTSNDFALVNSAGTTAAAVAAAPGAQITIGGAAAPVRSVRIDNVELRATAGQVDIRSAGSITVTGSASLAAPGYAKTFGDAADAVSVSAPGGGLTLVSQAGDIDFGSATRVSIGGGSGSAGTLRLSAANGLVRLPLTIDASAPGGAASLTFDSALNPFVTGTSGARLFDLPTFLAGAGAGFTGVVQIRIGEGDL